MPHTASALYHFIDSIRSWSYVVFKYMTYFGALLTAPHYLLERPIFPVLLKLWKKSHNANYNSVELKMLVKTSKQTNKANKN